MPDKSKIRDTLESFLRLQAPNIYYFLKYFYYLILRRASSNRAMLELKNSVSCPISFNEKIRYKMAYDRNPLLNILADKYTVRNYVTSRVGTTYLSELLGVSDSPKKISDLDLPTNFVVKANHGSGAAIIVWDRISTSDHIRIDKFDNWNKYLLNPHDVVWDDLRLLMSKWLRQNYYWSWETSRYPEWAYKDIRPLIMVEELMLDENRNIPKDFKFFMFNGHCEFIQVDSDRFQQHTRNLYNTEWQKLPFCLEFPNSNYLDEKPDCLSEMIQVAQELAKDLDFVRVDLYRTIKGVKFGEMTNYPGAGQEEFKPKQWDTFIGREWHPQYNASDS